MRRALLVVLFAVSLLVPAVGAGPLVHTFSIGREPEAIPIFRTVFAEEPVWAELLGRLPAAGLFPNDPALIARIRALAPKP